MNMLMQFMKQNQQKYHKKEFNLDTITNQSQYFSHIDFTKLDSLQKITPWESQQIMQSNHHKQFIQQSNFMAKQRKKSTYFTIERRNHKKSQNTGQLKKNNSITKLKDIQQEKQRKKRIQITQIIRKNHKSNSQKPNFIKKSRLKLPQIKYNIRKNQFGLFGHKYHQDSNNLNIHKILYDSSRKVLSPSLFSGQISPITFKEEVKKNTNKQCFYNFLVDKKKEVISKIIDQIKGKNKL